MKMTFSHVYEITKNFEKEKKLTVKKKLGKSFSNMSERCNVSFDFQQVAKNVSIYLTSCKKRFNLFNKLQKMFQFF